MKLDDKIFIEAYKQVEVTLRKAVEGSKSPEEFQINLAKMQLIAQRTLAILAFNSAVSSQTDPLELMPKITAGVRKELEDIIKAAQSDEANVTTIEAPATAEEDKDAAH